MALIYDSRFWAHDSLGNPISGATLTVYTAGTTTPASIYRDAALVTPMTNPTSGADKADASGRFPQVFATEGSSFDMLVKDASGSTVASYLNVVSLGSNTGSLTRDFTTSRFAARGSGGVTYVEAGDPVGDDVGGTGELGGWNGTQADAWNINALLVNIKGGRLKEQGYKLPSIVRSEAVTFSTAATVDIPLTNDPTGVLALEVDVLQLVQSAQANLRLRFSYDGGVTYKAGVADYDSQLIYGAAGGSLTLAGIAGQAYADMTVSSKTPANKSGRIRLWISTPNSGADATLASGRVLTYDGSANPMTSDFYASGVGGYGRATHVRLYAVTGTLTGVYRVMPQRGFGET